VLIVLIDDGGFGAASAFGGPTNTPNAERLAKNGLKFNRFHTTALCSPTRQALLTGRNHHSVSMGGICEIATSAPGYSSVLPKNKAPLAMTLKLNGYATAQFGKCHEVPVWETSAMGPFNQWPTGGGGFEYFYGFIGGETPHERPAVHRDGLPADDRAARLSSCQRVQDLHRLGGGVDFMRGFAEKVYGIPPEQVIGSEGKLTFEMRDGKPVLIKLPALDYFDDKEAKPIAIQKSIGRRPIAAFGNSDGDLQMLQWSCAGAGMRFCLFVRHTDAEREWAYDISPLGRLEKGLEEASAKGWTVVDMKKDWRPVFRITAVPLPLTPTLLDDGPSGWCL
jgi:Sulfatase